MLTGSLTDNISRWLTHFVCDMYCILYSNSKVSYRKENVFWNCLSPNIFPIYLLRKKICVKANPHNSNPCCSNICCTSASWFGDIIYWLPIMAERTLRKKCFESNLGAYQAELSSNALLWTVLSFLTVKQSFPSQRPTLQVIQAIVSLFRGKKEANQTTGPKLLGYSNKSPFESIPMMPGFSCLPFQPSSHSFFRFLQL